MNEEQKPIKIEWVGTADMIEDDKSTNPLPIDFGKTVPIISLPFIHPYPCPICDGAEYDRRQKEQDK